MRVLFVAAEVAPLAKVGGLADVAAALPRALRSLGHDVRLVMPRYAELGTTSGALRPLPQTFRALSDLGLEECQLFEMELHGVPLYLVQHDRLLTRERVYGYPDDLDRFVFFSRAALEACRALGWRPDVIHVHDWHTAIIPVWLHLGMADDPFFGQVGSVLTIHNLAFQGWFDEGFRRRFDLLPAQVVSEPVAGVALHSTLSLGVLYADIVNTVSQTYAREILTAEFGERLDPLLRFRQSRLSGIVNGIDVEAFDPEHDPRLPANYSAGDLRGKAEDKRALQEQAGLNVDSAAPLTGVVSRLTDQKGFDLIAAVLPALLDETTLQFVLLGNGEERYHRLFADLAARNPRRVAVYLTFDAALAERIYGGADVFLMPSRFEPCGLGQLISLRYGTVPVVRATGGLADTVQDFDAASGTGTGFVFRDYTPEALRRSILRALDVYHQPEVWRSLVQRGMGRDVSWSASALRYDTLYREAVAHHLAE